MHLRKKRRRARTVAVQEPIPDGEGVSSMAELVASGPSPEEQVAAAEAVAVAHRRLDQLGDKYGPIFKMRFADGYSESEIAERLHLNVATVKTRAYRARAALREELAAAASSEYGACRLISPLDFVFSRLGPRGASRPRLYDRSTTGNALHSASISSTSGQLM